MFSGRLCDAAVRNEVRHRTAYPTTCLVLVCWRTKAARGWATSYCVGWSTRCLRSSPAGGRQARRGTSGSALRHDNWNVSFRAATASSRRDWSKTQLTLDMEVLMERALMFVSARAV
jgi:hypothetical protein